MMCSSRGFLHHPGSTRNEKLLPLSSGRPNYFTTKRGERGISRATHSDFFQNSFSATFRFHPMKKRSHSLQNVTMIWRPRAVRNGNL